MKLQRPNRKLPCSRTTTTMIPGHQPQLPKRQIAMLQTAALVARGKPIPSCIPNSVISHKGMPNRHEIAPVSHIITLMVPGMNLFAKITNRSKHASSTAK